jgi:hypothetical protein
MLPPGQGASYEISRQMNNLGVVSPQASKPLVDPATGQPIMPNSVTLSNSKARDGGPLSTSFNSRGSGGTAFTAQKD